MSWKYAPTRTKQAAGADRFGGRFGERGHGDRMVVRARARRISSCSSGWAGSPSSIRLRSVCTLKTFSTIGSRHVISEPAMTAQSANSAAVLQRQPDRLAFERADAERRERRHGGRQEADRQQLAAAAHAAQQQDRAGRRGQQHDRVGQAVAQARRR